MAVGDTGDGGGLVVDGKKEGEITMADNEKVLLIKTLHQELRHIPWDAGTIQRYKFDPYEVAELAMGQIVQRRDTDFNLGHLDS